MSVQTLYTAATGMESLESKLDVIANNMANVSTVGFKKDRANFEDLFYRHTVLPGADDANSPSSVGISTGVGTRVSSVQSNFEQGAMQETRRNLDVAIEGQGFLQVTGQNGEQFFTRAGNLSINQDGALVAGSAHSGRIIEPQITIPVEAIDIAISPAGTVSYRQANDTTFQTAGNILLTNFVNPEGLLKMGENLYAVTDASGAAQPGNPGQNGYGVLRQNYLEASNVEPVRELIDLIQTQRNFELNSQVVQAGDEVMQLISNLRR